MNQNINDELRNLLEIICLKYGERLTGSVNNKELGVQRSKIKSSQLG